MGTDDQTVVQEVFFVDDVTNSALLAFPVGCVSRTQEIQQPFLHAHDGYELYMCLSGRGKMLAGGRVHEVAAGSLVVIHPGALHMPRSVPKEPFHRYIVSIDKDYLEELADQESGFGGNAVTRWLPKEEPSICWQLNGRQLLALQDILAQLERELDERKECFSLAAHSLVLQLFVGLGRYQEEQAPGTAGNGERKQLVEEMMGLVAEGYRETLRIESLCRRFHLSRSYLHRIFKQETGLSITEYLIAYRINKAKEALESSSMPLAEVALSSGFQDLSHFCRMFKRLTGVTPGHYRRSGAGLKGYHA